MTADDLFAKIAEEGFFVDSIHEKNSVSQDKWQVSLRAISRHDTKAWSYFPGSGPSLQAALKQAAGNGGVISGRADTVEEDMPRRRKKTRSAEDLLG